jgi:ATP-dependent DNA helicase RecQ
MPVKIECYVEAVGRAGRDGSGSQCTLFWKRHDVEALRQRVRIKRFPVDRKAESVLDVERYCAVTSCRHKFLMDYFGSGELFPGCRSRDVCGRSERF